jgi:hypothetical protein
LEGRQEEVMKRECFFEGEMKERYDRVKNKPIDNVLLCMKTNRKQMASLKNDYVTVLVIRGAAQRWRSHLYCGGNISFA